MNLPHSIAFSGAARAVTRLFKRGRLTVFMLHRIGGEYEGIGGHDADRIRPTLEQMRRCGTRFVSLAHVAAAIEGRQEVIGDSVAFTADDGYRDQAEILAPLFLEHGVPITLFVVTGMLDGLMWPWDAKINWLVRQTRLKTVNLALGSAVLHFPVDTPAAKSAARIELVEMFAGISGDRLPDALAALEAATEVSLPGCPPPEYAPTTWNRIRQLERAGLSVAPHTVTHRIVRRLSSSEVKWEIEESLRRVQAECAMPLRVLAWPVGRERHIGLRDLDLARELGVRISFAADGGYTHVRRAQEDVRARHRLGRFLWPDSEALALRYSTGLEAVREGLDFTRDEPRLPDWVMHATGRDSKTLRGRLGRAVRRAAQRTRDSWIMRAENLRSTIRLAPGSIERLVFICKGNICRSPFAEAVARMRGWDAESFGLEVARRQPADEIASKVALMLGVDMTGHVARPISDGAFSAKDCLVAMEPQQLLALRGLQERFGCQMTLLGNWIAVSRDNLPDPYGKSHREMERVLRLIEDGVDRLVAALDGSKQSEQQAGTCGGSQD